jgi:Ni/Co efflux regulator RcnB
MSIRNLMSAALVSVFATGLAAYADDGVVKQDQQRVEGDKAAVKDSLKKDRKARHEARRNKAQDKARLKKDRGEKKHDQTNP